MTRDEQKRAVAEAALAYVTPGSTIGVGTGSTAALFIEQLAARPGLVAAAVPSSEATAAALRAAGIRVVGLEEAPSPAVYVDGADAVDPDLRLIKGAGGALVREKIVASASVLFVCIVDESKLTARLDGPTGDHPEGAPVPLAVVPMATALVSARVRALGASPSPAPATSPTTASRSSTSPASRSATPSASRPSWTRSPVWWRTGSSRAGAPTSCSPAPPRAFGPSSPPADVSPAA